MYMHMYIYIYMYIHIYIYISIIIPKEARDSTSLILKGFELKPYRGLICDRELYFAVMGLRILHCIVLASINILT